jgi:glucuronoarabinoxylan endo-1,4-beta-xylanase
MGPTTFCTGGSVVLSSTTGPGYTYQWEISGVPISGETNSTYTATTTNSFYVVVTNPSGCISVSTPIAVSAAISPFITTPTPVTSFCNGGSVILTANTGGTIGTILYQWQKNGTNIVGANLPTFFATTTGSYVCEVTVSGGSGLCIVPTPPVVITVYGLPVPPITFTGVSLATLPTYVSYQWFANLVGIPGATSSSFMPSANGSYHVIVTDVNGCTGRSMPFVINTVGVSELSKEETRIFPNPATDVVSIESATSVKAIITAMDGRVAMTVNDAKQLNISSLPNGLYLIMLYNDQGERLLLQKLVKE